MIWKKKYPDYNGKLPLDEHYTDVYKINKKYTRATALILL